jgi:replicative DNA helicase
MGETIEGETHIHVAKNRAGSTDTIKLRFIKEYQKFEDLDDGLNGGFGGGGFKPFNDNPKAGINRDPSEFGGSKLFIPGGFQTLPSKANDVSWDDDDNGQLPPHRPSDDEGVPF